MALAGPDTDDMTTVSPGATVMSGLSAASKKPQCTVSAPAFRRWVCILCALSSETRSVAVQFPLVPAKAGTQCWIPACAGMSGREPSPTRPNQPDTRRDQEQHHGALIAAVGEASIDEGTEPGAADGAGQRHDGLHRHLPVQQS